ncbi:Cytochrome P450 monooxygenase 91 [Psilocybe cubensis]|uniref:Cytochrome P450 monooxygenase 91 n=2 Tax=Psilocybe cubensis TaxID=181762 RepID=A0ACB8HHS9_PSICU|nr:Cytochrome P450 monooxygenase 91 [Psilocybe cubensis]KAH9487411.1 Cytochrome P450 monooxygenase 91 [Psilocybe cubensis]
MNITSPFSFLSSLIHNSSISINATDAVLYFLGLYSTIKILKLFLGKGFSEKPFNALPGPKPVSWIMGNLGQLFNAKGLPFHQSLVDMYGGMVRVYGFFGDEQLYIADPRALQSIIIKDQDSFEETAVFTETNKVIFGPGLVATTGEQHKRQRRVVNPIFAVPHLKKLTPVFYDIAEKLADVIQSEIDQKLSHANESKDSGNLNIGQKDRRGAVIDMSDWMCRVALESVGQTLMGYSFDPLDSPFNNPYTSAIKDLIPTLFSLALVRQFAPFLVRLGPPWFRRKLVEWTPHKAVQKVMKMSDVMHETATEILQKKRAHLQQSAEDHEDDDKDIISILLRLNDKAKKEGREQLSDIELTGQMTVLIFGAQDTTSSCLSRVFHLLAMNTDVQDKVRQEIQEKCSDEGHRRLDFDTLSKLPWLDAVVKETLRLYPPVPFVRRTAVKETVLEYSHHEDHSKLSSVRVPAGTILFVSIAGSNRLESIWGPDAKKWRPERWLEDSKDSTAGRLPGIYSGMMSFLGGGRSCVGYRFAQIEMKIIIATLLLRFKMTCTEADIVWNLSQIISPSVRTGDLNGVPEERKGLPLFVFN